MNAFNNNDYTFTHQLQRLKLINSLSDVWCGGIGGVCVCVRERERKRECVCACVSVCVCVCVDVCLPAYVCMFVLVCELLKDDLPKPKSFFIYNLYQTLGLPAASKEQVLVCQSKQMKA